MSTFNKTHKLRTVPVFGATMLLSLTGLYFGKGYYEQSRLYKTVDRTDRIITQRIDESLIKEGDIIAKSYSKENNDSLVNLGMKATLMDTWNSNIEGLTKTLVNWVS